MLGVYNWKVVQTGYRTAHTYPIDDVIEHKESNLCKCNPQMHAFYDEDDDTVGWHIMHNAFEEDDE